MKFVMMTAFALFFSLLAQAKPEPVTKLQCSSRRGGASITQVCEVSIFRQPGKMFFTIERASGAIEVYQAKNVVPNDSQSALTIIQSATLVEVGRVLGSMYIETDTDMTQNIGNVRIVRSFSDDKIMSMAGQLGVLGSVSTGGFEKVNP